MCKRESASCCLPFPLFVHFSFSPIKFSATDFSASMSQSSNLAKYIVGQKTKMLRFIFTFSFHVSFFHLSLHIIHRETCVKDFSGPTAPRIWKPGTNIGCCCLSFPLFAHFSLSPSKFLSFYESHSLQILYTH